MKYRTIVVDPPWKYGKFNNGPHPEIGFSGVAGHLPLPYNTMKVEDIKKMDVLSLSEENCHLYLWTTEKYLKEAFDIISYWGFRYSQTIVWTKKPSGLGLGGAFSPTTEFVLFSVRGKVNIKKRINSTWFAWKRQHKHSKKPEAFYDLVENVSYPPYLDMFARRYRLGWDVWGDEVDSLVSVPIREEK